VNGALKAQSKDLAENLRSTHDAGAIMVYFMLSTP
jgi:hypothetical protein